MASITSWTRLEPRSRSTDLQIGLEARVHDPLWLIARQWQLGEFQAEDAGSPVSVRIRGEESPLTRFRPGRNGVPAGQGRPYDPRTPLEARVEREPRTGGPAAAWTPASRVEAGQHFLRMLQVQGLGDYRIAYRDAYRETGLAGPALDRESRGFARIMGGRAVDGERLYRDLVSALRPATGQGVLPATPALAPDDAGPVREVALAWLTWVERLHHRSGEAEGSWVPERMEYSFAVGAPTSEGEVVLEATEYGGDRLDWFHFARKPGGSLGASGDPGRRSMVRTVIPGRVGFRGMPQRRWWTFDEAGSGLGDLETGPGDLGRMLLVQYALTFGDDWFQVPVDLDVGSLLSVASVVVTDTFGVRIRIPSAGAVDGASGGWRLFSLDPGVTASGQDSRAHLFLPPVLGGVQRGAPVEEVHLLRDEFANLAWAVEQRVEGARGRGYDRYEESRSAGPRPPTSPDPGQTDADLTYRLTTSVPEHWIPLVPVPDPGSGSPVLRRGRMMGPGGDANERVRPRGRILEPGRDLRIPDEEVPREGLHVMLEPHLARWTDGSTHLWMGRRRSPGRGEGWSGLRFDEVRMGVPGEG